MADIRRIPFTEQFERLRDELVRDGDTTSANEAKYKGRINDAYTVDIPSQIDWRHIRETVKVALEADYTTGLIITTNGSSAVTVASAAFTTANAHNHLLKVDSYDEVYRVSMVSATVLTLDRVWVESTVSATLSASYKLFQDRYALAADFGRMALDPNKSVYYWSSGTRVYLIYKDPDVFEEEQTTIVGDPQYYTIKWVDGSPYIFIDPPPTAAMTLEYVYIPSFARMTEYTTGNIKTLSASGTAVTASGTAFTTFVADTTNYDYYFRIDGDGTGGDSRWYPITTAPTATTLTLTSAYEGTEISAGSSNYTISKVSLLPEGLDLAIVYAAAIVCAIDQDNNTQAEKWAAMYDKITNQYRSIESKKNYGQQRMKTIYEKRGVRQ